MSNAPSLSIRQALQQAKQSLFEALAETTEQYSASLESEILLAYCLKQSRSYLRTWPERLIQTTQLVQYQQLITQRCDGQPIAYLTGNREFWGLELCVSADTLIPRPETEHLVELCLDKAKLLSAQLARPLMIVDLGTGSGAVALAIASELPLDSVVATDLSLQALTIAHHNQQQLHLKNVQFVHSHWLQAFKSHSLDIVVSNPPYIATEDPHLKQGDLRFEPASALSSGIDGLQDIRLIIDQSWPILRKGGWLLLEHGFQQETEVTNLLNERGFQNVSHHHDYAGLPRVSVGCK